jgi:hypothetical protein
MCTSIALEPSSAAWGILTAAPCSMVCQ